MGVDLRRHAIVNVTSRGILGGWCYWCSCGHVTVALDGSTDKAVVEHLAGAPDPPRAPRMRRAHTEQEADR